MKILAIDSSTKKFSLAVSDGDKVLRSRTTVLKKVLSSSIIPAIDGILKAAKLKLQDLDVFVIGLGPGSFTSLRVGLSTIKALSFALNKPVIGVPSLDAVAHKISKDMQICVISDAKRNLVYTSFYEKRGESLKRKSEYLLTPLSDLLAKIDRRTIITGDALAVYHKDIEDYFYKSSLKDIVEFAPEKIWHPDAKSLIAQAQSRCQNEKFDNLDKLIPLYLYPDNCQVQR